MFKKLFILSVALLSCLGAAAELPNVTLKDMYGETVNTAELDNEGKPMIITFWATWCKPCIRELKALAENYDEWQDETGVRIIAVSIDEAQNEQKVRPFIEGKGWDFQVLLDPNSEFKRQMGVTDPPHAFIVDGNGNIVWNHKGYTDGGEEEMIEQVRKLVE